VREALAIVAPREIILDEGLGFGIEGKLLLCQPESTVMDATLTTRRLFPQVNMKHLMVEHVGQHIFRDPKAIKSPVDHDGVVGSVEMAQDSSILL
jgi:hypothetical protein